jgi:outer membrane receptor protein involved in Fe transport
MPGAGVQFVSSAAAPDGLPFSGNRKVGMMNLLIRFKGAEGVDWLRVTLGLALALAVCLTPVATTVVVAQEEPADSKEEKTEEKEKEKTPAIQHKVTVTATRTQEDTFNVPQPVAVVTREEIAERNPNTSTDLLRELPGVDVNGVGTNQPRPFIRGQRGQRVLLLEDGIRMNNPRRELDFGELAAIVDVSSTEQVEVVRGPASVLYGSDAIGGVVNTIGMRPASDQVVTGSFGLRYSTADEQQKAMVNLNGTVGMVNYLFSGVYRSSSDYDAPAGSFGEIDLEEKATVFDTGVDDDTLIGRVGFNVADGQEIFFRIERYRADTTGFGYVDPATYESPDDLEARVRLIYPFQDVDKLSVGYSASNRDWAWANSVQATLYWRNNERQFDQDIFIPFGSLNFGLQVDATNFTDVESLGVRFEANKVFGSRHVMTYGLDWYEDDIEGTNTTITTLFGPPDVDETPTVPNSTYGSWGLFAQDQWQISRSVNLIFGARHQETTAETRETPNMDPERAGEKSDDKATVGAVNLLWSLDDNLKVVGSVGTAFRSPNTVERFFAGFTPDGSAIQIQNLDLKPEKSLNYDLGFKYRRRNINLELTYFRNEVKDGIRIGVVEDNDFPFPDVVQYENVDELVYAGAELGFNWAFWRGFSTTFNYTYLTAENQVTNRYTNESYPQKLNFMLRYDALDSRWWVEYHYRRNGVQDNIQWEDPDDIPAVGAVFPDFNVVALRGGVTIFRNASMSHQIGLAIENLTDKLYTETSNASFFRPDPGRNIIASYRLDF